MLAELVPRADIDRFAKQLGLVEFSISIFTLARPESSSPIARNQPAVANRPLSRLPNTFRKH